MAVAIAGPETGTGTIQLPRRSQMMERPMVVNMPEGPRSITAYWYVQTPGQPDQRKNMGHLKGGALLTFVIPAGRLTVENVPGTAPVLDPREQAAVLRWMNSSWLGKQSPMKYQFGSEPQLLMTDQQDVVIRVIVAQKPYVDEVTVEGGVGGDSFVRRDRTGIEAYIAATATAVQHGEGPLVDALDALVEQMDLQRLEVSQQMLDQAIRIEDANRRNEELLGIVRDSLSSFQEQVEGQAQVRQQLFETLDKLLDRLIQTTMPSEDPAQKETLVALLEAQLEVLASLYSQLKAERDIHTAQTAPWKQLNDRLERIASKGNALHQRLSKLTEENQQM